MLPGVGSGLSDVNTSTPCHLHASQGAHCAKAVARFALPSGSECPSHPSLPVALPCLLAIRARHLLATVHALAVVKAHLQACTRDAPKQAKRRTSAFAGSKRKGPQPKRDCLPALSASVHPQCTAQLTRHCRRRFVAERLRAGARRDAVANSLAWLPTREGFRQGHICLHTGSGGTHVASGAARKAAWGRGARQAQAGLFGCTCWEAGTQRHRAHGHSTLANGMLQLC